MLDVRAPAGTFYVDPHATEPIVLIGAGIGVTPLVAMLEAIVHAGRPRDVYALFGFRHGGAIDPRKHVQRFVASVSLDQPSRTFGHEEQSHEQCDGGNRCCREHPAPSGRAGKRQQPVNQVGEKDSTYDCHLVQRNEPASNARGSDFSDVQRRQQRGSADGDAADESCGRKLVQRTWERRCHRRRADGAEQVAIEGRAALNLLPRHQRQQGPVGAGEQEERRGPHQRRAQVRIAPDVAQADADELNETT